MPKIIFPQEGPNVIEIHIYQTTNVLTVYKNGVDMSCNFSGRVRPCVKPTRELTILTGLKDGIAVLNVGTTGLRQFSTGVSLDHYTFTFGLN